ncbi:MAG TPA: CocE/NonD family hydrolase [Actinomycetota bacterium]|nr:CocE/NonD family hydrolase [Actinomycetota bacterium]
MADVIRRMLCPVITLVIFATLTLAPRAEAAPNGYVEMSDGTLIAVNVRMPKGYVEGRRYPTIFEMSGYDGGSSDGTTPGNYGGEGSRGLTKIFEDNYVTIHASVRGTGCSSGEFDLFSWRSALDGREVVEWIAEQPWSNGDVGIYGHSYGGITGFMVAATRPPHLKAVSVSGLIDDLYRGIVYPGGVSNYGFPLAWTGVIRNLYDVGGGTFPGLAAGDEQCARNLATHRRTILNDPIVQGLSETDNAWFQARSLINYAERIRVPVHITGAYQDEQTGPRGPYHLFEELDVPAKRLLMSNGDHGTQTNPEEVWKDRRAWLDHWIRGTGPGYERSSVRTLLEMSDGRSNARKDSRTFPLEDTSWTDFYLKGDGGLDIEPPGKKVTSSAYLSGSPRQAWSYQAGHTAGSPVTTASAPDELEFVSRKFRRPTAVIGPATATLFASSTAPDTELFVQLIDEAPDGSRYYLQRGMLKASHRAYDPALSDKRGGVVYRPYRPHTNPTEIEAGKTYRYLVEIFPLGHVFRPGHRLVVKIHTPPIVDSYYAYVPKRPVGINTVFYGAKQASKVTLPVVSLAGVALGPAPKPCSLDKVRCVP